MHPLDEPENDPPFDLMALQSRLRGGVMCVGRIRTGFKLPNGNMESVRCTRTSEVASRDKHGRELRQTSSGERHVTVHCDLQPFILCTGEA